MSAEPVRRLLHLGCGQKTIADLPRVFATGWRETRVDVSASVRPDVTASLPDLEGVPRNEFDAAWLSHVIEHLFAHEAVAALRAIRETLTPTGSLVVTCPDIREVAKVIAKSGLDTENCQSRSGAVTARDALYGWGPSTKAGDHAMARRNGFDLPSLSAALTAAGFAKVFGRRRRFDLWFIASRAPMETRAADDRLAAILNIAPSHQKSG